MELGGNAPFIVLGDADLARAVDAAVIAKLRNAGQSCVAANRFFVHETIASEFAERLSAAMSALQVASPFEGGEVGPLIDGTAHARVTSLVNDASANGARLVSNGNHDFDRGWFYPPTVVTDLDGSTRLLTEEIFGPIAPITSFDSEAEIAQIANATPFGLAAYVFTSDVERALRLIDELDTGMVGLNRGLVSEPAAPFGGVKTSGLGREGGGEGIDEYLELKYVAIDGSPSVVAQSWGSAHGASTARTELTRTA
jgi:succinate-semialdehyde dehydrogenase/glutarate-semialdehyde dehydrogenase